MAKYLFVYRSDKDTFETMGPEELQRYHQKWQTWIAEGLQKGWMLDASTALKTEGRVVNAKVVTGGRWRATHESRLSTMTARVLRRAAACDQVSPH